MQKVLDYALSSSLVHNADGTHILDFNGGSEVAGPASSTLGRFNKALHFGGSISASTKVADINLTLGKFTVRAVVKPVQSVTARQNIVGSDRFPFALFLNKGPTANTATVVGSVNTASYGWRRVDSRFRSP